jgi:hypothetical protein
MKPQFPSLVGQRVLLIAPRFFGYEKDIQDELTRRGAAVDFILDRPFESAFMKALARFHRAWVMPAADRYMRAAIRDLGQEPYDIVLVINGQTLSRAVLAELRQRCPDAKFVLYMWDSAANRSDSIANAHLYDRALTFDREDAKDHGLVFRPLFYGPGYATAAPGEPDLALSFIGTVHTDRYRIVSQLMRQLPSGQTGWTYLYLQAPWVFHLQRILNPAFRGARMQEFSFAPLPKAEVQNVFRRSRAILDVEHSSQRGLTIRTLEAFGAGKKLVTTNAAIRDYDFFKPENIAVIARAAPELPSQFLARDYVAPSDELYYRYSIAGWMDEVLGDGAAA